MNPINNNPIKIYKPNEYRPPNVEVTKYECGVCGFIYPIPKGNNSCTRCPQCFNKSCSE